MQLNENQVYTAKEAADAMGISVFTIKRLMREGKLSKIADLKKVRFSGKTLIDFINADSINNSRGDHEQKS